MTDTQEDAILTNWPAPGIARLVLARDATMNTLTWEMMDAMEAAFRAMIRAEPRAVIVTGRGRAFCGGAQLTYFTDPESPMTANPGGVRDVYVRRVLDVFGLLRRIPCPVIAAINGHALGGGMELAIACDFRLMSASARIGQPEVRLGLAAGGNGVQQLQRLVGRPAALDLLLSGDSITAEAALAMGLVGAVHAPDALLPAALTFAERFLVCGPRAVAATKRAAYRTETASPEEADAIALDAVFETFSTAESREGMTAFVEKRPPAFAVKAPR
ncbi:enoyl-CoA hydratase/isomerase family protein [Chachezhania sediminis]|uniref:enoyl-CoA hydratase/isomerase family protein n=1 Tax=Chachezhania sediminis TaxID=2599291 RepID=UPI00131C6549|nr:enoyl-CoA hydratase/isomerase family protein [Chachezhania sediminis]